MPRSLMDPNYVAPTQGQLLRSGALRGLLDVSPVGLADLVANLLGKREPGAALMDLAGMDYGDQSFTGRGGAEEFGRAVANAAPGLTAMSPLTAGSRAMAIGGNQEGKVKLFTPTTMPQVAERYPETIPGVLKTDPKTGKEFIGKQLSPEALAVQKLRKAAQAEVDAGNYEPYFDVSKRGYVDPSHYPLGGDSRMVVPKRADTIAKWESIVDTPEAKQRVLDAYKAGSAYPGAKDWYAMRQLEQEFIKEYGAETGRKMFKERFADAMAATTGGADPTDNLVMAHYGNYLKNKGLPVPESAADMPFPVGGRYASGNMGLFDKFINGGVPFGNENPKRMNFAGNFTGHQNRGTIDEQMMGLLRPGALLAPEKGTYGIHENVVADVAKSLGIPTANVQDVAWAGGKVAKDPTFKPRPMIQIVNEAIARTSKITGMSPEEIVRRGLVRAEIPLYGLGGASLLSPQLRTLLDEAPAD